jgi:hypothetical protein
MKAHTLWLHNHNAVPFSKPVPVLGVPNHGLEVRRQCQWYLCLREITVASILEMAQQNGYVYIEGHPQVNWQVLNVPCLQCVATYPGPTSTAQLVQATAARTLLTWSLASY